MTDRIDPAEGARLREQLAQHFALPLKAGRHHPDWAVGPVAKHRGDHVSWYFTDLTEEQAKATAALLNALPALLDAADAAEVLAHAVKGATAENEALRAENERLRGLLGEALPHLRGGFGPRLVDGGLVDRIAKELGK